MSPTESEPYEALASLIERQLQLAGERRFDELQLLDRARAELQAALPEIPPAGTREVLERCAQLHKRVEIELLRVRELLLLEMAQVRQAQRTANGYAPARPRGRRIAASA
jgi:hypothetical protein